jgi:hypothetical protein
VPQHQSRGHPNDASDDIVVKVRFAPDSTLEGDGFELTVPGGSDPR